jgi:uncharacterized protein YdaU (DUF1376 family)
MAKGAIRIDWFPGEALAGMKFLTVLEELAYRRILDLLYTNAGELPDDETMAEATRTFSDWERVREGLIRKGKIAVEGGVITNEKCTEILTLVAEKSAKASASGKASGKKRRTLVPADKKRSLSERSIDRSTDAPTNGATDAELSHIVSKIVRETNVSLTAGESAAAAPPEKAKIGFAAFFNDFPRKDTIFDAEAVWDQLVADGIDPADIIAGMHRQIRKWTDDGTLTRERGRFLPSAVSWLQGRRWLDPIETAPAETQAAPTWPGPDAIAEAVAIELRERGLREDDAANFCRSYLHPAGWSAPSTIIARTNFAAEKLRGINRLKSYQIRVEEARAA